MLHFHAASHVSVHIHAGCFEMETKIKSEMKQKN
jgi:hypothetical protein